MTKLDDRRQMSGFTRRAMLGAALAATTLFGAMAPVTTAFGSGPGPLGPNPWDGRPRYEDQRARAI